MKYAAVLLAFAASALAQSTITTAPTTTAAPVSVAPSISCVQACTPGDVNCQAACLGIARPNSQQVVDTTKCAEACDQGNGSAEDTKKYADCQQACIASFFPSSQTGSQIPGAAASSRAATGTGSNSANPTATTGANSGSGSATPQSTGAANSISARFGGAGLAGLLAIFAL